MPLSDSPSSLETLEALGNYLTDLQLAVDQVASTLRSLNAIAPAIPDAPKTLSRNLGSLATGADALALGISGLRWRTTQPVAATPAKPDLVVAPDPTTIRGETTCARCGRQLVRLPINFPRLQCSGCVRVPSDCSCQPSEVRHD